MGDFPIEHCDFFITAVKGQRWRIIMWLTAYHRIWSHILIIIFRYSNWNPLVLFQFIQKLSIYSDCLSLAATTSDFKEWISEKKTTGRYQECPQMAHVDRWFTTKRGWVSISRRVRWAIEAKWRLRQCVVQGHQRMGLCGLENRIAQMWMVEDVIYNWIWLINMNHVIICDPWHAMKLHFSQLYQGIPGFQM